MLQSIQTVFLFFIFSQEIAGWELLATVEIGKGYDEFMGTEVDKPTFSDQLKEREDKKLTLEGFIISMQEESDYSYFVLSRFPYQSCFFCGGAGPETVVEIYLTKKINYTDERVQATGTLRLNKDNPLHLFYILEDSEVKIID